MYQLLKIGQTVQTRITNLPCKIESFLGFGGQGEVYKARLQDQSLALKWYFPENATSAQRDILEELVEMGPPNRRFLWPIELVHRSGIRGFGYLMPLRELHFKGLVDLMKCRVDPSISVLCTAGYQLVDGYYQLHAKGLCYRDISFGNAFLDPQTGDVLFCDNDNVTIDNQEPVGVVGTPRFMAPEIIRGEANPSTQTDLFSLSVLLFYLFIRHHPLEGMKEAQIHCLDLPAMRRLYGEAPVFIYDPTDDSNRPVRGLHDNALILWPLYPQFLRYMFTRAFTNGLHDPGKRVRETEWRQAMIRLRDSIFYCSCGAENFYDIEALKSRGGQAGNCWSCSKPLHLPPRIRIDQYVLMLNHDTRLYPHHVDRLRLYDFGTPVAGVSRHPQNPNLWGLRNLTQDKWTVTRPDGSIDTVEPGRSIAMQAGLSINFGSSQGEIRI